ncbi:MAG: molecular chaperone IbpA [Phenylobacterium sp.]|jgi:molecular chaperone IbpA
MQNLNLSPLYRSFIGFEQLASQVNQACQLQQQERRQQHSHKQQAQQQKRQASYPPYNVESLAEDKYRITMAVAGFSEDELSLESSQNQLVVTGTKTPEKVEGEGEAQVKAEAEPKHQFLYQGIANRNFERKFQLDDFVKVTDASIENGLLHIELAREVPEAMKPRKVPINSKGQLLNH